MRAAITTASLCALLAAHVSINLPAAAPGAAQASLDDLQKMTAGRAGEAFYLAETMGRQFWPTMKDRRIALMVVEPGAWCLLINHPAPPSGFAPAGEAPRHLPDYDPVTGDAIDKSKPAPGWPVHLGDASLAPDLVAGSQASVELAGVRTAVVRFNEATIPRAGHFGWPPTEAVILRMVRGLWMAHLDDLEGAPAIDPLAWEYEASADDLAYIEVEQRLLARLHRMVYNEKTMADYRRNYSMWLAVRRARAAANPEAVAVEEAIERRQGLGDFTETVPFRLVESLGREERPHLQAVDPFFEQYRNFFILRLNLVNYPLIWHPATPVQAMQHSRATGASLAFTAGFILPQWHLKFFGEGSPWKTLRDLVTDGLAADFPKEASEEAALLNRALEQEGHARLAALMRAALDAQASAAAPPAGAGGGAVAQPGSRLTIDLAGLGLREYHAPLDSQEWLRPGVVEANGPMRLRFDGGELSVTDARVLLEAGPAGGASRVPADAGAASSAPRATPEAGPAGGAPRAPARVTVDLPPDWALTVDGRAAARPRPGSRKEYEGRLGIDSPALRLSVDSGKAVLSGSGVEITLRPRP